MKKRGVLTERERDRWWGVSMTPSKMEQVEHAVLLAAARAITRNMHISQRYAVSKWLRARAAELEESK